MKWLGDDIVRHLRHVSDLPDLGGTRYRLVREIGRGGMGTVYLAHDAELDREVAVKVLASHEPAPDAAARMLREARIIARLEHPGIVPVHDAGVLPDGRAYYAMKLVRGRRLDEHVDQSATLSDRLRIFQRLCDAVAFAHAHGVIHRDLKPANVMVGPFGEVLVMDWGTAKVMGSAVSGQPASAENTVSNVAGIPAESIVTAHGTVIGTPGYMAPEQSRGEVASVDARSDVHALGAILRFLCEAPASAGEKIPRPLRAIIRKAISPERHARYADARELGAEIVRYLDGLPVAAYLENPLEIAGRWVTRHRVAVAIVVAYLLMRFVLMVVLGR